MCAPAPPYSPVNRIKESERSEMITIAATVRYSGRDAPRGNVSPEEVHQSGNMCVSGMVCSEKGTSISFCEQNFM